MWMNQLKKFAQIIKYLNIFTIQLKQEKEQCLRILSAVFNWNETK